MSERVRRDLPEEPVSSSLSEVRALLRDAPETPESARGLSRGAFEASSDDPHAMGAELREVLSSAPSAADLEAERRARWAEEAPAIVAPKSRLRRGVLTAGLALFVAAAGAAFWLFRQPSDEPSGAKARGQAAVASTPPAPVTSAASAAISGAPIEVPSAPSVAVSAPTSAASPPAKAPKKRPQRRNVDRQFDDVLDRL